METKECKMRNILANVGHSSTADLGHVAIGLAMVADAISELADAMVKSSEIRALDMRTRMPAGWAQEK